MGYRDRIEAIIGGEDIVVFMKGDPAAPKCGFSAAVVKVLDACGSAEGFSLCTTPICSDCDDFEHCFGSEDGESMLARQRNLA